MLANDLRWLLPHGCKTHEANLWPIPHVLNLRQQEKK